MSEQDLCHSIKLKRNIVLPQELERKINSITEHQRRYIRNIFLTMAQVNPTNATILCDYLVAEQNELNIKESTKESTIKRIIWFSAFLNHKIFDEITKDDILTYLNSRIKKPASVDPTPHRRDRVGDADYHELMKGHDVMITAPKELVQLLETLKDKWIQTI